jgi:hypothetical protein
VLPDAPLPAGLPLPAAFIGSVAESGEFEQLHAELAANSIKIVARAERMQSSCGCQPSAMAHGERQAGTANPVAQPVTPAAIGG